jgi:hypothetical protein
MTNLQSINNQAVSFDEWIRKSYDRLAELRPALFRRPEEPEKIAQGIDPDTSHAGGMAFEQLTGVRR